MATWHCDRVCLRTESTFTYPNLGSSQKGWLAVGQWIDCFHGAWLWKPFPKTVVGSYVRLNRCQYGSKFQIHSDPNFQDSMTFLYPFNHILVKTTIHVAKWTDPQHSTYIWLGAFMTQLSFAQPWSLLNIGSP